METPDGFLSDEQERKLREAWDKFNSRVTFDREMTKLMDNETSKLRQEELAKRLKYAAETIMDLINMVHHMTGPERLEIRNAMIKTRNGSEVPADIFLGDIKVAVNVLEERLKG